VRFFPALLSCALFSIGCGSKKKTPALESTSTTRAEEAPTASSTPLKTKPRTPPLPPARPNPTPEALERKARSERILRELGVPILAELPVVDTAAEAKPRAQEAVVDRAIALMLVAVKGEGLEQEHVDRQLKKFSAQPFLSPEEVAFIAKLTPTQLERAKFGWRYEGLSVMTWALGYDAELNPANTIVDAGRVVRLVLDKGPADFRSGAKLRPVSELLDANDLVYRMNWACVNARVNSQPAPRALDCEIVLERHHALNWLIGYQGQAWDDVSTDT
jgi:hypothetical protein